MNITVEDGLRDATVLLDGSECAVTFSSAFKAFEIQNDSEDDIIASVYSGKTAEDNGIRVIHSGCSGALNVVTETKTIYLKGTGKAFVAAGNTPKNSFNTNAGGGDGSNGKNYSTLVGKPQINGVELVGNKSLEDLGIHSYTEEELSDILRLAGFNV